MTLTVPQSSRTPGRAPELRVEAETGLGQAVAEFGRIAGAVGDRIVADRLQREGAAAQTGFTRDLGALRLDMEQEADPDRIDAEWPARVAELRARYLDGRDIRLQDRLGPAFDELANRHAFALGQRGLSLRRSAREADWLAYERETLTQAARGDGETRDTIVAAGLGKIDALEADGTITPEEAQRRRMDYVGAADNAAAIAALDADPRSFLNAEAGGAFDGVAPEARARYRNQATARIEAQAAAEARAAEKAATERTTAIGKRLDEIADIAASGRRAVDEAWLADPEVQAHPGYARAMAAVDLRRETPGLAALPLQDLDSAIAIERAKPVARKWQTERLTALEDLRARAAEGWRKDPVAFGAKIGQGLDYPDLPEFDPADPAPFSEGLAARARWGRWLTDQGYTEAPAILSADEAAALKKAAGPETDPETRLELARAVAGGLAETGGMAGAPDLETGIGDPVFARSVALVNAGAPKDTLLAMYRGQQALEAGTAPKPGGAERMSGAFGVLSDLTAGLPGGEAYQAQVMAAADALYADARRGTDPGNGFDAAAYKTAMNRALGQTDLPGGWFGGGQTFGGVQEVQGHDTLLPPGIRADTAQAAIDMAVARAEGRAIDGYTGRETAAPEDADRLALLTGAALTGLPPDLGSDPAGRLRDIQIMALPGQDDAYVLRYEQDGRRYFVEDAEGGTFAFSLSRLIAGAAR